MKALRFVGELLVLWVVITVVAMFVFRWNWGLGDGEVLRMPNGEPLRLPDGQPLRLEEGSELIRGIGFAFWPALILTALNAGKRGDF